MTVMIFGKGFGALRSQLHGTKFRPLWRKHKLEFRGAQCMYKLIFNTESENWMDCNKSPLAQTKSVDFNHGAPPSGDWELTAQVWHAVCYCLVRRLLKDHKSHINNHDVITLLQIVGSWAIYLINWSCVCLILYWTECNSLNIQQETELLLDWNKLNWMKRFHSAKWLVNSTSFNVNSSFNGKKQSLNLYWGEHDQLYTQHHAWSTCIRGLCNDKWIVEKVKACTVEHSNNVRTYRTWDLCQRYK